MFEIDHQRNIWITCTEINSNIAMQACRPCFHQQREAPCVYTAIKTLREAPDHGNPCLAVDRG